MTKRDIANVILDIVDREMRYVTPDPVSDIEIGTTAELRMQLREVAFALIQGKDVTPADLKG